MSGGEIRFDVFAQEHLHGEKSGFYGKLVNLADSSESRVPTPSQDSFEYRNALAQFVVLIANEIRQRRTGERNSPVVMAEIGGGAGELKREILSVANQNGIPLDYISIEPNEHHRQAQTIQGTRVLAGMADNIPLPDSILDLLIDEEVLDCLPIRVLEWNAKKGKFERELFVSLHNEQLRAEWRVREATDNYLDHREHELKNRGYDFKYYHYAPRQWQYLAESGRVLRTGGVKFAIDYGYNDLKELFVPNFADDVGHELMAIANPYSVDLTHYVDFHLLSKLSTFQGAFRNQAVFPLTNSFSKHSLAASRAAIGRYGFLAVKV